MTTGKPSGPVGLADAVPAALPEEAPQEGGRTEAEGTSWPSKITALVLGFVRVLVALFLFVGSLQVMKMGAAGIAALNEGGFFVLNPGSTFGLGWLGALLVLSGSPVAASSLTLVASGAISEAQGFTMLTGSRLGAAFVVLLVAVTYSLRKDKGGGRRGAPLSTAVMALSTTAFVYVPGAALGFLILKRSPLAELEVSAPAAFSGLIDLVYDPLLSRIGGWPPLLLFAGGLGLLLVSLKLIDSVVPELDGEAIGARRPGWLDRKWPMFALGCLVALVTMSVSVALTVLVPLVAKRYADRWNILPYIIGANITTLGDTFLAALLLDSPEAVRIVAATITGTTVVSLVLLGFFYDRMRLVIWRFQRRVMTSEHRLAAFTASLFAVPLVVLLLAGLAG